MEIKCSLDRIQKGMPSGQKWNHMYVWYYVIFVTSKYEDVCGDYTISISSLSHILEQK